MSSVASPRQSTQTRTKHSGDLKVSLFHTVGFSFHSKDDHKIILSFLHIVLQILTFLPCIREEKLSLCPGCVSELKNTRGGTGIEDEGQAGL